MRDMKGGLTILPSTQVTAAGLHLLFASGTRPTRAAIAQFLTRQRSVQLSHDPAAEADVELAVAQGQRPPMGGHNPCAGDAIWVELLRDGLTYDLCGLAPGPSIGVPEIRHRFDFVSAGGQAELEMLTIIPGPHLAGGERSIPVLRGMIAIARDLTQHFPDLVAIYWAPSGSAIGRRYFESVVTAWLEGGAFPALGLTAFEEGADGALQSVGLAVWIGQELRIEPPLTADRVAATRLGVRLINQLVIVGGLDESERIIAPDGTRLVMQTSRNSEFIRVRRE
jgi:hypothetical protein